MSKHREHFGKSYHGREERGFSGPIPGEWSEESAGEEQAAHHGPRHHRGGPPHFGHAHGRGGPVRPPFFGPHFGGHQFGRGRGGHFQAPFFGPREFGFDRRGGSWGFRRGPFGRGFGPGGEPGRGEHGWGRRGWGRHGRPGGERGWGRYGEQGQGPWRATPELRIARLELVKARLEAHLAQVNQALEQLRAQQGEQQTAQQDGPQTRRF